MVDLVREGRDVIVTRSFSKIYGMAGLRVGYAISTPANAQRIRDWNMTIGLNSAGLAAALASYNDNDFLAFSRARILQGRAMIVALNRPDEFRLHVRAAVNNGVTREEIKEVLLHAAVYCGAPAANSAFHAAQEVFSEMKAKG